MTAKAVKSPILSCLSKLVGAAPCLKRLLRDAVFFIFQISLIVLRLLVALMM